MFSHHDPNPIHDVLVRSAGERIMIENGWKFLSPGAKAFFLANMTVFWGAVGAFGASFGLTFFMLRHLPEIKLFLKKRRTRDSSSAQEDLKPRNLTEEIEQLYKRSNAMSEQLKEHNEQMIAQVKALQQMRVEHQKDIQEITSHLQEEKSDLADLRALINEARQLVIYFHGPLNQPSKRRSVPAAQ
ncbi:hypothetical protein EBR43_08530 [bacterium]|nr:hypothetical protein [bacterium]NBX71840.1 hypothetical protein [bacterium]